MAISIDLYRTGSRLDGSQPLGGGVQQLITLTGSGFGVKADNNADAYTYGGQTHTLARFTDFDGAATQEPVTNTEAGWKAHLDGIFPIVTATDFNSEATASKATLELTGSPTPSGKWLKRKSDQAVLDLFPSNGRLRNWNLFDNDSTPRNQMYVSYYINSFTTPNVGKWSRIYWTGGSTLNKDLWIGMPNPSPNGLLTARAEYSGGGETGIYADQPFPNGDWVFVEMFYDFESDVFRLQQNGVVITDTSRLYTGDVSNWLGTGGVLDYVLMGNTMDTHPTEDNHYFGWARPYMDFSFKRVLLSESATYTHGVTYGIPQPITAWSDTSISFVTNLGHFSSLTGKYFHVVDNGTTLYTEAA